jgi:hypothetical protein
VLHGVRLVYIKLAVGNYSGLLSFTILFKFLRVAESSVLFRLLAG